MPFHTKQERKIGKAREKRESTKRQKSRRAKNVRQSKLTPRMSF